MNNVKGSEDEIAILIEYYLLYEWPCCVLDIQSWAEDKSLCVRYNTDTNVRNIYYYSIHFFFMNY